MKPKPKLKLKPIVTDYLLEKRMIKEEREMDGRGFFWIDRKFRL